MGFVKLVDAAPRSFRGLLPAHLDGNRASPGVDDKVDLAARRP
jgi:hypothetical protein